MSEWNQAQDEVMLLMVLQAQTKNQYQRALAKVADKLRKGEEEHHGGSRTKRRDGDPCRRRLWGLAVRAVEYPGPSVARTSREGFDWSWAELLVLKWAFTEQPKQADGKPAPDNEYIASLLYRTVDEVREKRGLDRPETKGFGIL